MSDIRLLFHRAATSSGFAKTNRASTDALAVVHSWKQRGKRAKVIYDEDSQERQDDELIADLGIFGSADEKEFAELCERFGVSVQTTSRTGPEVMQRP